MSNDNNRFMLSLGFTVLHVIHPALTVFNTVLQKVLSYGSYRNHGTE